jgi:hypothetical protein
MAAEEMALPYFWKRGRWQDGTLGGKPWLHALRVQH